MAVMKQSLPLIFSACEDDDTHLVSPALLLISINTSVECPASLTLLIMLSRCLGCGIRLRSKEDLPMISSFLNPQNATKLSFTSMNLPVLASVIEFITGLLKNTFENIFCL